MTMLWMDGFDHYGAGSTGADNMVDGVYAEASSNGPSATQARTGTYSMHINSSVSTASTKLRRVFPNGAIDEGGIGLALYATSLVAASDTFMMDIRDLDNFVVLRFTWATNGVFRVYRGEDGGGLDAPTLLGETVAPVIVAAAWQHIEFYYLSHASSGGFEVRWNGVTVLNVTGVQTKPAGVAQPAQFAIRTAIALNSHYVDDLYAWDTLGSFNNDFIGDRKVATLYPDGVTSAADYTINGAGLTYGYEAIDETSPDDDTTYLGYSDLGGEPSAPKIGEFTISNLPAEAVAVSAVQIYGRMKKTDAGQCDMRFGIVSGADIDEATSHPITTEWTYWSDVFEVDPATGAPFTPAALNDALITITREG